MLRRVDDDLTQVMRAFHAQDLLTVTPLATRRLLHMTRDCLWVIRFHWETDFLSAVVSRQSCIHPHDKNSKCWFLLMFFSHSSPARFFPLKNAIVLSNRLVKKCFQHGIPHFIQSIDANIQYIHYIRYISFSDYKILISNARTSFPSFATWYVFIPWLNATQNLLALIMFDSKYDREAKCWPFHFAGLCIFSCHIVD